MERQRAHQQNDVRPAYHYADYLVERRKMVQASADYLDTLFEAAKSLPGAGPNDAAGRPR